MKRVMRIALLLAVALLLCASPVAAWHIDGDTLYYDGVPIQWPDDEQAQQDLLASLNAYGPPPMPPDWPVDVVEAKAPVTYKNQDSGPSVKDIEIESAIRDYNERYAGMFVDNPLW